MARFTKNHMLEMGAVLLVLGLVLTTVASILHFGDTTPAFLREYERVMRQSGQGDFNLLVLIAGPILLIWGGFWVGEQVIYRRRFERLIETPKRSEFTSRRSQLEEISKRLPDGYRQRIKAKESEFTAKRA